MGICYNPIVAKKGVLCPIKEKFIGGTKDVHFHG